MTKTYYPKGVCSSQMDVEIEDGVVRAVNITGGCAGNLQGVSALVVGRRADEVVPILRGISCGKKATSCPDQLARAIEEALQNG